MCHLNSELLVRMKVFIIILGALAALAQGMGDFMVKSQINLYTPINRKA